MKPPIRKYPPVLIAEHALNLPEWLHKPKEQRRIAKFNKTLLKLLKKQCWPFRLKLINVFNIGVYAHFPVALIRTHGYIDLCTSLRWTEMCVETGAYQWRDQLFKQPMSFEQLSDDLATSIMMIKPNSRYRIMRGRNLPEWSQAIDFAILCQSHISVQGVWMPREIVKIVPNIQFDNWVGKRVLINNYIAEVQKPCDPLVDKWVSDCCSCHRPSFQCQLYHLNYPFRQSIRNPMWLRACELSLRPVLQFDDNY